jgi:hypothetical protein
MKKNVFLTIISGLILLTFCSFVYAKGLPHPKTIAPSKISPLIYKGIKFVVPNTVKEMGYVQAWDMDTGKKVWEKKVYSVIVMPFSQEDVQHVFIISLSLEDGKLVVVNDNGREYRINIPKGILKN